MNRRLLILGYYFVDTNMGGVRLRRIARLLPRHGWDPVVLTHPPDREKGPRLPDGVKWEAVEAPDLTRIYQKLRPAQSAQSTGAPQPSAKPIGLTSKLNRWLMIPDKQVPWKNPAIRRGRELLRNGKFDAIFASLEPRTMLLAAARLAQEFKIPCVMEYRDLWTGNPYYHLDLPTPLHRWLHRRMEHRSLREATAVSAVCRGIADYLRKTHGSVIRGNIDLNYNFYDPEEYPPKESAGAQNPLIISYMGAMYANRSPHQLFEGLRAFLDSTGLKPSQLRFRWAGPIAGISDIGELLDRTGVRPYLDFLGQVSHQEALKELLKSNAALLIQAPGDAIHIPGKLFEAMGARVPLLALSHPCEVTEIIERCRAGMICPHTSESVAAALHRLHDLHRQRRGWEFETAELNRFSAEASVSKLAALFNRVCS